MRIFESDVLCIGAGLAGERVAVEAAQAGFRVICLSVVPPKRSHSSAAMGGMQAALGNSIMGDGDCPKVHFADTVKGSDWGCDQEVARLFAETAPIAMREMAWMGVPWSRVVPGEHTYFKGGKPFQATEKKENEGLIHSRAFGGTAKWRTCYTSDGTGHAVLFTLDNRLLQLGVEVHDRMQAEVLVHNGEHCMGCVARDLRTVHRFNGYIHLKSIPGASRELVAEAGRYADRMSVNIEIPTERNLQLLAPDKNYESIYRPMSYIQQGVLQSAEERTRFRHAPRFAPAGQSTQMIVGATDESDRDILLLSSALYGRPTMKRVYYSGFIPVNPYDKRLPALDKAPLVRENRLYQADWLMRFYGFRAEEIADEQTPRLDLDIDPKLAWALRNPAFFPVDVNRADYEALLRVPGIGVKSARLIVSSRRYRTLTQQSLRQIGVVMKKAQYFISCRELTAGQGVNELRPEQVRRLLTAPQRRRQDRNEGQLTLF